MPHHTSSDESLLQATGRGDFQAFEEIVRRHHSWAWRVACRYLNNDEDATDVVQEAFLRMLAASNNYQPRAAFRTYFYRIISRLCFDQSRKKHYTNNNDLADVSDPKPSTSDIISEKENKLAIRTAIDALPDKQRMTIVLRYYEELSYQEIAVILDLTPKAVERLLSRGRTQLRVQLRALENF